jgi:uncharacterized protein (TIGR02271 family)
MPLYKLEDFDPKYRETFGGEDVKALELYTEGGEKVGAVADALVDPEGRFRYLVIDTGIGTLGKKILLPIGLSRIDYGTRRVYVDGLSRTQVQELPEYKDSMVVDYDYEEQVRGAYRSVTSTPQASTATYDRNTYNYQQDPKLYNLNDQNHQTFKLYEERLIASKSRVKTGEVAVGKHIETETAQVTVPIEKERVVIERITPSNAGMVVPPGEVNFQEGEVARIEVYEETPEIHKEAFVREEVKVTKVVEQETVEAQETIRREELDVDTEGNPIMDQPLRNPNNLT